MMTNQFNSKSLFSKRNQLPSRFNQSHKIRSQRLLSHSRLRNSETSKSLLAQSKRPEVATEVVAEAREVLSEAATEVAEAAKEAAEAKEEKAKKVLAAVEVDIAVAEVAVAREEKAKKAVKSDQKVKTDQEAAAEAEVEADPKVKKVLMSVMKVFFTFKERRQLITLARTITSKVREVSNGTHMTEDQAPAEAEVLLRAVTVKVTGASQRMR